MTFSPLAAPTSGPAEDLSNYPRMHLLQLIKLQFRIIINQINFLKIFHHNFY